MNESTFVIDGSQGPLIGVLHRPAVSSQRAVLMIVGGGPQYRVGGHRQLTLWARRLSAAGHPVLRFDHAGMGDSPGRFEGFTALDDDIRAAIDRLVAECPQVREVVLWGECSAASAGLYYAWRDPRVSGAVLLNLWVRSRALAAKTTLRYYYLQRILQPSFWRKLLSGSFDAVASTRSALDLARQAFAAGSTAAGTRRPANVPVTNAPIPRSLPLAEGLLLGLSRFKGRLLLVQSGRDLIAREFDVVLKSSPAWQQAIAACDAQRQDLPDGDHTFSSAAQRDQVAAWALDWLADWPRSAA